MKRLAAIKAAVRRFAMKRDWNQFHTPKNLAMAMSVEASEVVEIFQWLSAKQSSRLSVAQRAHLADELADTYIYLLRLADKTGIDLLAAAGAKLKKNAVKYPVAKSRGLAKKYTEL